MEDKKDKKTTAHKMFKSRWNKLQQDRDKVKKTIKTSPKGSAGYITAKAKLGTAKALFTLLKKFFALKNAA